MHQAERCPGQQRPANFSRAPIAPAGGQRQKGKKYEQRLVDVIAAVKNQCRRDGREEGGPNGGFASETIRNKWQEQDEPHAKQHGDQPEFGFGQMLEVG